jgi:hypothetical protein
MLDILLDIEASYMAIGVAARLALALGLHRASIDSHSTTSEIEQRRNVFWVLYVQDRCISLRLGRPPTICEDDIEVSEPIACRLLQPPHVGDCVSYFAHFVKLARIKSGIYSKLYSVRSPKGNRLAESIATVSNLDEKLAIWRESLPELPPLEKVLRFPNLEMFLSTVLLHAEYYNCQLMLHRSGLYGEAFGPNNLPIPETSSTESHSISSRARCLTAARHTAQLLNSLRESGHLSRNNLVRYDPVSNCSLFVSSQSLLTYVVECHIALFLPFSIFSSICSCIPMI